MSRRIEPPFEIGATAQNIGTVTVERDSDVYLELTVGLPDVGGPILSGDIVDTVFMMIRTTRTASSTTYETDSEMGGDLTVSRPDPNTLKVIWHLEADDSALLELAQSPATLVSGALRTNFPTVGIGDMLAVLSNGDKHFICTFDVSAVLMITRGV